MGIIGEILILILLGLVVGGVIVYALFEPLINKSLKGMGEWRDRDRRYIERLRMKEQEQDFDQDLRKKAEEELKQNVL